MNTSLTFHLCAQSKYLKCDTRRRIHVLSNDISKFVLGTTACEYRVLTTLDSVTFFEEVNARRVDIESPCRMARATRSSANIEKSDDSTRATTKTALTKKRKRASVSPHDDQQPSAKHSRTESEDEEDVEMSTGVGDLPLGRERAVVILDVLEMSVRS